MAKVTFSLDNDTVDTLRRTAIRLRKPQSAVVREAIAHYAEREDRLSDEERDGMLTVIDRFLERPPSGPRAAAAREIQEVRRSRRTGWRPGAR